MIAVGIDAGASSTRWVVLRDGVETANGVTEPLTGHLFARDAVDQMAATVDRMGDEIRLQCQPDGAMAGVSGLTVPSRAAELYRQHLAAALKVDPKNVTVDNDMTIAYRAAFAPGEGILVYAGTGSIAYHLTTDGIAERAGGHGYLIDDAGGGFWIGQQALRAALRARDQGDPPTLLHRALYDRIGDDSWEAVRAHVYRGGRQAIAALVPVVVRAASDGDGDARALLRSAGNELARLARVMVARVGQRPIALAGGVARASDLVVEGFRAAAPELMVNAIDTDNAHAAALLALSRLSPAPSAKPSGAPARNSPDNPRQSAT